MQNVWGTQTPDIGAQNAKGTRTQPQSQLKFLFLILILESKRKQYPTNIPVPVPVPQKLRHRHAKTGRKNRAKEPANLPRAWVGRRERWRLHEERDVRG